METTFTDKATSQEAAELQHTLERGYKRAYQAARETWGGDPWGSDYRSRFQTAVECNEVAADVMHETLRNGMRRPCESTADFLLRTKAEAQPAEGKRAIPDGPMDQAPGRRGIADRKLMDAAAMRHSRPQLGLYELHSRLDSGHLNAARQLIADAAADTQHQAEAG